MSQHYIQLAAPSTVYAFLRVFSDKPKDGSPKVNES